MQISKAFLIVLLAGAAAWPIYSQPATPEQQGRALELLRQTISQQRPTAPVPMTSAPNQPKGAVQQEQAIQLLRGTTGQQLAAPPSSTATQVPAGPKTQAPGSAGKGQPAPKIGTSPRTPAAPAIPEQPAGPRTKQQKLNDLLQAYRADKFTPSEYQVERAKILAEP